MKRYITHHHSASSVLQLQDTSLSAPTIEAQDDVVMRHFTLGLDRLERKKLALDFV